MYKIYVGGTSVPRTLHKLQHSLKNIEPSNDIECLINSALVRLKHGWGGEEYSPPSTLSMCLLAWEPTNGNWILRQDSPAFIPPLGTPISCRMIWSHMGWDMRQSTFILPKKGIFCNPQIPICQRNRWATNGKVNLDSMCVICNTKTFAFTQPVFQYFLSIREIRTVFCQWLRKRCWFMRYSQHAWHVMWSLLEAHYMSYDMYPNKYSVLQIPYMIYARNLMEKACLNRDQSALKSLLLLCRCSRLLEAAISLCPRSIKRMGTCNTLGFFLATRVSCKRL